MNENEMGHFEVSLIEIWNLSGFENLVKFVVGVTVD